MKFKADSFFRFSIPLTLLAGILWTVINLVNADDFSRKMRNKLDTIKQLREIKQQSDLMEASFAALAAVSNTAPSLSALIPEALSGPAAEIRELDSRSLARGWNVKRTEVVFKEVSLNSVADFLRCAETQRPPWRLTECVIRSSSKAEGYGSAALIMETLAPQP